MKVTTILGIGEVKVDKDLNLYVDDKTFTAKQMKEYAAEYKGTNRIHKPMLLLFWTDVKNNQASNWN